MHHLQHITELGPVLERAGVRHVIISPGSRNAPLIQLFTSDERFICHSIVDERSAAYVALGMSRQLGEPLAVVTTSGTAVLNLSPALAEAFQQQLPLFVLTADRPREFLSQFDNQVCDQRAPYFNFSKGFLELPAEIREESDLKQGIRSVEKLFGEALTCPRGPVHLNLPLTEPLYVSLPDPVLPGPGGPSDPSPIPSEALALSAGVLAGKKVLVLAGMGAGDSELQQALEAFQLHSQVAVLAENISNFNSAHFISVPELVLAGVSPDELQELVPDLVIAFGQQVVSKRLKLFIQSLGNVELIEVQEVSSFAEVISDLSTSAEAVNAYGAFWKKIEHREGARAGVYLGEADFGNLTAIARILDTAPSGTVIHLGNSSTIRLSQLLLSRPDLSYYANRGISGIDGSLSTAVGAAMVSKDPHLLLLGDLSFVYDSNALWNKDFPDNLKIVVLNDGGGGIFRLIDGPGRMDFFEEFSVTHHPVSLELLSTSFGRSYCRASNMKELEDLTEQLFEPGSRLSVLEVDTTRSDNTRIFKALFT